VKTWSVDLDIDPGPHTDEEFLPYLVDALSEFHAVASGRGSNVSVLMTVEAASIAGAVSRTLGALEDASRDIDLIRIKVRPDEDLDRELEQTEEFVGVAEIARALGVSKQRASELYKLGRLPRPIARLRAGPIWRLSEVRQALGDRWKAPATPASPSRP
jgi:hypothetical protein